MIFSLLRFLLKCFLFLSLLAVGLFLLLFIVYNEPIPNGYLGPEANELAEKMMRKVNKEAWDSTHIVQWSFIGSHHFLWDRKRHLVQVEWSNYRVLLNPNTKKGKVFWKGEEMQDNEDALNTAYSHFTNDAFWLNAYTQIYNGAPELRVVDRPDGKSALLVTYLKGGVTPGDSYLWIFDDHGMPESWQMWVGILPIGGLKVTWQDWDTLPSGALYAKNHKIGPFNVKITNVKAFQTWEEGGYSEDVFKSVSTL